MIPAPFVSWCPADRRVLWDLWVLVMPRSLVPPRLAQVRSGPDYTHVDGHAVDEVWTLHDGTRHHVAELHVVAMEALLAVASRAIADLLEFRFPQADDVAAVHWAARMCLEMAALGELVPPAADERQDMIGYAETISELERAQLEARAVRLPNLGSSLRWAGALELARLWGHGDGGWCGEAHDRIAEIAAIGRKP